MMHRPACATFSGGHTEVDVQLLLEPLAVHVLEHVITLLRFERDVIEVVEIAVQQQLLPLIGKRFRKTCMRARELFLTRGDLSGKRGRSCLGERAATCRYDLTQR